MHFIDKCRYAVVVVFGLVSTLAIAFSASAEAKTTGVTMACTAVVLAFLPGRGEGGRCAPPRAPEEH